MEPYELGEQFGHFILPIILVIVGLITGRNWWKKYKEKEKMEKKES